MSKRDKARMDWLTEQGKKYGMELWEVRAWGALRNRVAFYSQNITPRQAIDAAMREERK